MNPRRNSPEHEKMKLALEGAALVALAGLAARRIARDRRLQGGRIESGDLLNSTVVKALERAKQFRGQAKETTWLHQIMVNDSLDEAEKIHNQDKRQLTTVENAELAVPSPADTEAEVINIGLRKELIEVINLLPDMEKQVLFMFFFQDMQEKEIAERLGMPIGTVKSHKFRGLARMRDIWQARSNTA